MIGEGTVAGAVRILELENENAELRQQLAQVQEQCIELAVDAGELHAELEALRQTVAELQAERDRIRLRVA